MAQFDETEKHSGLDPNFFLPPNVIDLRYSHKNDNLDDDGEFLGSDGESLATDSTPLDSDPDVANTDSNNPESDSELPIPENVTVISQTVRVLSGGGYVIDVVLNVPDLVGVENFDIQVAKV